MASTAASPASIAEWSAGDRTTTDALFSANYEALERLASIQLRRVPTRGSTSTTSVVHEAYLKLAGAGRLRLNDPEHFFCLAARVMRQVVLDRARRRRAEKRGGATVPAPLDEGRCGATASPESSCDVSAELGRLRRSQPRLARIVWLRFGCGLSVEETAATVGISERSVKRDCQRARELLHAELLRAGG